MITEKTKNRVIRSPFITEACPFCGFDKPQLQVYQYGIGMIVKCPECWAITKVKHTWLSACDAWNNGEWSEETLNFAKHKRTPQNMDDNGVLLITEAILTDACKCYRWHYRRLKERPNDKHEQEEVEKIEKLFRTSPMMNVLPLTGEDIIIKLRREVDKGCDKRKNRIVKEKVGE